MGKGCSGRMSEPSRMICPNCGAEVTLETTICPDCREDLSALAHLEYRHAILYNEALALAQEGKLEEARARLLLALEVGESFAPAHILLAKVYAHQGDWDRARDAAGRALSLVPSADPVHELLLEIDSARREDETKERNVLRAAAVQRDPNRAVHQLAAYQRDIRLAFGLGVGAAAFVGLLIGWVRVGRHGD